MHQAEDLQAAAPQEGGYEVKHDRTLVQEAESDKAPAR